MIEHYSADFYTFAILTFALLHSILVKQHSQPGLPEQDQEAVGEEGGGQTGVNQVKVTTPCHSQVQSCNISTYVIISY